MVDVLIIGGGVSGLSAGIYSCLAGFRVTVCEKHFTAGGNLTAWDRGGYHIDNCIHWLTGTNPATKTYKMWQELGVLGNVRVHQGNTLYTCEKGGVRLSLNKDLTRTFSDMLKISPDDEKEIRSLICAVKAMQGICGIAGENHDKGLSFAEAVRSAPSLIKYYSLSTGELASRFSHPALKFFISSFWGDDFGALALIMVFAHYCGENGGIPAGGSSFAAESMKKRFSDLGGRLILKKEAVKINRKGGKAVSVTFADGETLSADYIIVSADPASVFGKLLDIPMPRSLRSQYERVRLKRFSSYHCAFSCDLASVPFEGDFIFEVPLKYRPILRTSQVIVREFSHEKSFAPAGKNILQTMTFCYEDEARKFIELRDNNREMYEKRKQELSKLLEKLIISRFPEVNGRLKCIDVWTPATYKRYTNSEVGSYMSFVLPSKMIPRRISARVSGLSNLFLATQWQQLPGGLPTAAECGRAAAMEIARIESGRQSIGIKSKKRKAKGFA